MTSQSCPQMPHAGCRTSDSQVILANALDRQQVVQQIHNSLTLAHLRRPLTIQSRVNTLAATAHGVDTILYHPCVNGLHLTSSTAWVVNPKEYCRAY